MRRTLSSPSDVVTVPRSGPAGSVSVAAAPRTWESARLATVSWFPAGSAAAAVASPAPGTTIKPGTPITLTFNHPVSKALGASRPAVSPRTAGSWQTLNAHTIVFRPTGYGYGLGAKVQLGLPSGVRLAGGQLRPGTCRADRPCARSRSCRCSATCRSASITPAPASA